MAAAQLLSCLCSSIADARLGAAARFPQPHSITIRSFFASGSPLLMQKASYSRSSFSRSTSISIKCEQGAKEANGVDVWLGRLAMIGFASAISVEIATGKGLLENFGLTSPLPTVALAVTALVGVLTAIFIFQSASKT